MEKQIRSLKEDIKSKYKTLVRGSIILDDINLREFYYYESLTQNDVNRIREAMRTTPDTVLSYEVTNEERASLRSSINEEAAGNISQYAKINKLDREAVSRVLNGRSQLKTPKVKEVLKRAKKKRLN